MPDPPSAIEFRSVPLVAREDVDVQKIYFRGQPYHIVKDPLSLKYFHLEPAQYTVWKRLDGQQSLEQLRSVLNRRFPTLSSRPSDVQHLVTELHQNGLTRSLRYGQGIRLQEKRRKSVRQKVLQSLTNPFFIRLPPLSPGGLIGLLNTLIGWAFSTPMLVVGIAIVLAAWLEAATRFTSLRDSLPSLEQFFGWPNLIWLWLSIGFMKLLHEFGHAVACHRVGCRCHGIGAGLLVFSPTLYCDASDSWICRNKWDRMGVAAAGMYVELLLGAVAVFVWSHTHQGLLHSLALNIAAISTVTTVLFNANPLIRFDGYYIFSDWLEIPNLQEKSSRLLYRSLAWCLGLSVDAHPLDPKSGRAWFVLFAVLSLIYRWFIMGVILISIYAMVRPYRIESLGGIWIAVVIIMMAIGMSRTWYHTIRNRRDEPIARRRQFVSLLVIVTFVCVILAVPVPNWRRANFEVIPRQPRSIYSTTGGRLLKVHVAPGERVSQGDPIVELENDSVREEIRALSTEKSALESEVNSLRLRNRHADLIVTIETLRRVTRRLNELEPLLGQLVVRSPADGRVLAADHRNQGAPSEEGVLPVWDGHPLQPENVGATLAPGALLAQVQSDGDYVATIYVDQHNREDLRKGQRLELKLDALPSRTYDARITSIASSQTNEIPPALSLQHGGGLAATERPDGSPRLESAAYRVIAEIDGCEILVPGMRGTAQFRLEERTLFQWLSRAMRSTFYFRM